MLTRRAKAYSISGSILAENWGVHYKVMYKIPNSLSGSHNDSSVQLMVKIW